MGKIALILEAVASIAQSAIQAAKLIRARRLERKREKAFLSAMAASDRAEKNAVRDYRTQVGRKSK
jgi:hypothetical protein